MRRAGAASERARPMTLEEWAALDDAVAGELVDGVLEEEEMSTVLHELVVMWMAAVLRRWARRRDGFVLGSDAKVVVGPRRGRKPDLSVILPGAIPALDDSLVRVAPRLVVEVVSRRRRDVRRDRVDKLADYAAARIRHYLILDPHQRSLDAYALDSGGSYRLATRAARGRVRVPGCAGLVLDLDALWIEIDQAVRARQRATRRG